MKNHGDHVNEWTLDGDLDMKVEAFLDEYFDIRCWRFRGRENFLMQIFSIRPTVSFSTFNLI